jgi:hypothetical protein
LDADIRRTMGSLGCTSVSSLSRDHVVVPADTTLPREAAQSAAAPLRLAQQR